MADFCTVSEVRAYINPSRTDPGAGNDDTQIGYVIPSSTSAITRFCDRNFEPQGSAANRTFTYKRLYGPYSPFGLNGDFYGVIDWGVVYPALLSPYAAPQLQVDDFFLTNQTIGSITVTDYVTSATYTPTRGWPYNAAAKGLPYTRLEFAAGTSLPTNEGGLVVNAKWGWITVPTTIKEAALLTCSRYLKRRDAPEGVAGFSAMGSVVRFMPQLDPDVQVMCADYRRWDGAFA